MSDTDADESTVYSKPHLDPQSVKSLAASIPNCSRISPPNEQRPSESSYFSSDQGGSYFSNFGRRLQQTFSSEAEEEKERWKKKQQQLHGEVVLSFLVSDAYSIEQLAAEAEGKHTSTSELEGAGIARIDVYCQSGTVCTCRVIQTHAASIEEEDPATAVAAGDDIIPSREASGGSPFMHMLPTPRHGNMTQETMSKTKNTNQRGGKISSTTQVRRIIRRKCTMEALRRILEQPPKLPEIDQSIFYNDDDDDTDDDTDDASQCSTVSKKLRKRQQKRQKQNNPSSSNKPSSSYPSNNLSKVQQNFLIQQQIKYEKRILRDEKVRQHVGNAILAGGMVGCEDVDLSNMKSLSVEDTIANNGMSSSSNNNTNHSIPMSDGNNIRLPTPPSSPPGSSSGTSDAYHAQKAIQYKIEIADMGLAILMGEAQRLERMMVAMKKEGQKHDDDGDTASNGGGSSSRSKRSNRTGGGSFSTFQSTDRDDDSDDDDDSSASASSSLDSQQKLARVAYQMQGCEVEYSFPHEFHDVLESALMGDEVNDDDNDDDFSSSEDDASEDASSKKIAVRRGRGRSPPKKKEEDKKVISPIIAIPTNGEGSIVLRENGAFDVIGKIPDVLSKKLFRSKGPLPDQISLGTLGRYYVHFSDGSFHFYGPPSLSKILTKSHKAQKQRRRTRGQRGNVSIVSVAFGKELADFFVVGPPLLCPRVQSDGAWEAHGNLPSGLEELMTTRKGRADLHWVALGVNDEWCVRAKNGRVWWEGVSDEADEALADILAKDGENELKYIDFGIDETYFLLHK
ncbi:hypothetical protein ACHAXR_007392 [Thalassiosira sp. AJA248-18]